jgi:2-polyprenyl-3-methyl-5-hydroxy-6-metoxy-1,4-benzoquinol methylase
MTTSVHRPINHEQQVDALLEHMLESAGGVFTSFAIYIGHKLGYYGVLSQHRALTSTELASLADTHERYTREWLEQQAVAGILDVEDPAAGTFRRKYRLPAAHAEVLANPDSVNYLTPLVEMLIGVTRPMRALLDCYRHGGGISYADYGADMRHGQGGINRMTFLSELGDRWLPQVPGLQERLQYTGARIMDFGCGCGWSSIAVAKTYPDVHVDAYDLDSASIEEARAHAADHGVAGRITFHCEDVTAVESRHEYDLFITCETLHDLADPVGALRVALRNLKPDGTAIVVDERVADTFMGEGGDLDWMMYGWSILHCLPAGMADGAECHCGGTGTVMRLPILKQYAAEAGFDRVDVLPIENLFFNIYQLNV